LETDKNIVPFCAVYEMKEMKKTTNFLEFQTKVCGQDTSKKVGPEGVSFWANGIFTKKTNLV